MQELKQASLEDVRTTLWKDCLAAEHSDHPFAATKDLLGRKQRLAMDRLFDDAMLAQIRHHGMKYHIYNYLLRERLHCARDFMRTKFDYSPSESEVDSDSEDEDEDPWGGHHHNSEDESEDEEFSSDEPDDEDEEDEVSDHQSAFHLRQHRPYTYSCKQMQVPSEAQHSNIRS